MFYYIGFDPSLAQKQDVESRKGGNMVYQGSDTMRDGDAVEVRLASDDAWYKGVVLKPRKMWVQLENHPAGEMIADENNIVEWRKV